MSPSSTAGWLEGLTGGWPYLAVTAAVLALAFWRLRAIAADRARAATAQGDVRDA